MAKKREHYVNNKEFLSALIEYKKQVQAASIEERSRPRVSNYIGECFMKIAVHLSYKPNFSGYTFRDEMVSDGIENCLQYIDNFDPERENPNPFSYFTQIIYFAFLRRIAKEKKLLYIKLKHTEQMNVTEETAVVNEHDRDYRFDTQVKYGEWSDEYVKNFISDFEDKKRKEKEKQKLKKGVGV